MAVEASRDALLVQQFVNTRDLRTFVPRGHPYRDGTSDDIASPASLGTWLTDRGLLPVGTHVTGSDHARMLDLRAALRSALDRSRQAENHDAPPLQAIPVQIEVDASDGPRLSVPREGVDRAMGEITAAALRTTLTGEWWRLRVCAADDCQWVFYDESRPGRGRYCSPDSCGNRVKTRAYRRRRAGAAPAE